MPQTDRQQRLERLLSERWCEQDPDAVVRSSVRPDGKVDITVVSSLFEGRDSREREGIFWPVFDPVPKSELIYMTYCLLLTPEESNRNFSEGAAAQADQAENWDE